MCSIEPEFDKRDRKKKSISSTGSKSSYHHCPNTHNKKLPVSCLFRCINPVNSGTLNTVKMGSNTCKCISILMDFNKDLMPLSYY